MANHILFVCTGNTCRSPMAESLFRRMASREGLAVEVRSAGVAARGGSPISANAAAVLQEKGIAAQKPSTSKSATGNVVDWAELILTMTIGHKRQVIQMFPQAVDKTFTLKEFTEEESQAAVLEEKERLLAELHIKQALSQPITDEERRQMAELEQWTADLDIIDPFGGSMDDYRQCAFEIEKALGKLIIKIKSSHS